MAKRIPRDARFDGTRALLRDPYGFIAARTRRLGSVVLFFLQWPWSAAARVFTGWQNWAPYQPDALWSNLHMSAAPGGGTPVVQVGGTYLGSVAGCRALLAKLYSRVGSAPLNPGNVFPTSYRNAMMIEAGCGSFSFFFRPSGSWWPQKTRTPLL